MLCMPRPCSRHKIRTDPWPLELPRHTARREQEMPMGCPCLLTQISLAHCACSQLQQAFCALCWGLAGCYSGWAFSGHHFWFGRFHREILLLTRVSGCPRCFNPCQDGFSSEVCGEVHGLPAVQDPGQWRPHRTSEAVSKQMPCRP